ncbi:WAT1-related protein At4g08300-like isoform X2 [Musa acuminata AAA Group]|uniref:WAT1-related protein At4g08300-like isoform X2 n=1 Tax=Musa acuminata AAA Group TaxID=214697 RepID=UPI0031D73490
MAFMGKRGPLLGMIYVQVAYAAMFLITRLAFTRGMSHYGFVLYRQIIAAVAICPIACFLDREIGRLTVRWKNAGQIFLLALMGISISQNFYYAGLAYTSSTLVSTMNNLQPAITFLLAYLLRLEEVSIKNRTGQAKILGTFLCVGGAMVMTLFKDHNGGQGLQAQMDPIFSPHVRRLHGLGGGTSFVLGALFTIVGTTAWSAFLLYQGIFCAGFGVFAMMWCVKETGPVYVTAFSPVSTVMVAILEPLLLHVQLTWSSLIAMVMVIGGLFLFLWGKAQDSSKTGESFAATHGVGEWDRNETSVYEEPSNQEPLLA